MITFQLLGPVCVKLPSGDRFPVPTPQVRALLVALLREPSTYVPFDRLAEHIWTDPPSSARANLRTHAAALRKVLNICEAGFGRRIETSRGGAGGISAYRLLVDPRQVDAATFASLADRGQAELLAGQLSAAVQTLTAALDLWHGPIGVDLPNTLPLQAWANSLTERRLAVIEDLAEARLELGDHSGLVAELRHQATENPLRERLIELLMRGLHVTGDRPAAIAAYQDYRHRLAEELGIEPSARLQQVHLALLSDEPIKQTRFTYPLAQPATDVQGHGQEPTTSASCATASGSSLSCDDLRDCPAPPTAVREAHHAAPARPAVGPQTSGTADARRRTPRRICARAMAGEPTR